MSRMENVEHIYHLSVDAFPEGFVLGYMVANEKPFHAKDRDLRSIHEHNFPFLRMCAVLKFVHPKPLVRIVLTIVVNHEYE